MTSCSIPQFTPLPWTLPLSRISLLHAGSPRQGPLGMLGLSAGRTFSCCCSLCLRPQHLRVCPVVDTLTTVKLCVLCWLILLPKWQPQAGVLEALKLQADISKHNFVRLHMRLWDSHKAMPSHLSVHCSCFPKAVPALGILLKCIFRKHNCHSPWLRHH